MAFSIVQHPTPGSGSASPTTAVAWASAPTSGNLLVVALNFRGNATVTEATTQGWTRVGTGSTNGTTCQTEIWYLVATAGMTTAGPTFNIAAAVSYDIQQAEVTGFAGNTPTFDQSGTASGTTVSTLTVTSTTTTAGTEFVFACCGDSEGATSGLTWSASTAGGSATLGADIDTQNPAKNGQGLRDTWATSGSLGTTPSITHNLSATTNTRLASILATFKPVAVAAQAGIIAYGYGPN